MNLLKQFSARFSKIEPLPEGTHHKQAMDDQKPYRLHLRLQKNGSGVLIVNASTILQLNPTAAEYAFHFIKGTSPEEVAQQVAARYRVNRNIALADFNSFAERIHTLVSTPDLDPVSFLEFERASPHSTDLASPLRLDCALTYALPHDSQTEYAPVKRVDRELATEEWQTILDRAWQVGIPQIVFTGGEATLREDLPDLIAHVEKNGQVCGLLTDGLKLTDKNYLEILLQTGLDHVMVILQPGDSRSWQAIQAILKEDLFLTVHLTINKENVTEAGNILQKLANFGVENISLSTSDDTLLDELLELQSVASSLQLTLRWDLPVPYSASHPVSFEMQDEEIPSGAGKEWMYVEPDGDVLPAQGEADKVLGNFLRSDWETIFKVG